MNPIKTVYNFLLTFQLFCLVIFIFYFIENDFDLVIPISFYIRIPASTFFYGLIYDFSYDFHFNIVFVIGILLAIFLIYLLSSITVVGSGLTDTGTISIKQIISFIVKFSLLNMPVIYLFSLSSLMNSFSGIVTLISLLIYAINFLTDTGEEKNA